MRDSYAEWERRALQRALDIPADEHGKIKFKDIQRATRGLPPVK